MVLVLHAKDLKEDLKKDDIKFDKGTESTVQFIRLVSETGQNTDQSNKTVLIQRIPEYEVKQDATATVGDESKVQALGQR